MPSAIQYFSDLDSLHHVTNNFLRPQSAVSLYQNKKISSSTMVDNKQVSDTRLTDPRQTPRYIKKDKEELYQELLQLQQKYNLCNEENTKLKTQISSLEKQVIHLTDLVRNVEMFCNKKTSHFNVFQLKKQIQDLKTILKTKEQELESLKQNVKTTKIDEIRIELQESHIECLRLRTMLDQQLRQQVLFNYNDHTLIEEKLYIQSQMMNQLKTENDQMTGLLKIQEEETYYYKNLLAETLKTVRRYEETIEDLHKNLKGKNQFMDKLAQKIEALKNTNNGLADKVVKVEDLKEEIRILKCTIEDQNKQIKSVLSDNEYLKGMVHELKIKNNEKSEIQAKEKKVLQDQIAKISNQYDLLDDKYKNLLLIQVQAKNKETAQSSLIHKKEQTVGLTLKNNNDSFQQQQIYVPKKLRAIKMNDVLHIGEELNYRFRIKKIILIDVIEQFLFDDDNKKEKKVSIKQLQKRFEKEPFMLFEQDKALMFARFLIEDNSQEFVEFNIELTETLERVKSIFTKIIGNYRIFTAEEEMKHKEDITKLIIKYKNSLKQHFDSLQSNNGELTKRQILETFIFMDIDINNNQLEYFFLKLFVFSNKIDRFPYQKIFEIFQQTQTTSTPHLQRKETQRKKANTESNKQPVYVTKSLFKPVEATNLQQNVDAILIDPWVCIMNAIYLCENCAMILSTEPGVTNIKKYSQLNAEERERMQKGGNEKFQLNVTNVNDKFHSHKALQYRFELALGLSEFDSDISTNYASPNKSLSYYPEQKKRLNKALELEGIEQDIEWMQIQYQILTRDLKKKIDKNFYLTKLEEIGKKLVEKQKQKQKQVQKKQTSNQNDVFSSFSALLKKQT
ncbi:unnamed protein product [Paramecium pentaurelia]|uniref:Uncharacterized protein n=1 Tax=Paramecium pentaurelia TaxID=43138 RepID=A0A8S1SE02_9CILI|nr:unnamed protein product [Paramecium pentaurelia]